MNSFVQIEANRVLSAIKDKRIEFKHRTEALINEYVDYQMRFSMFNPFPARNRESALKRLDGKNELERLENYFARDQYHLDTLEFLCNAVTTISGREGRIYISSEDIRIIGKYLPIKY